jgi:hypothetical protein
LYPLKQERLSPDSAGLENSGRESDGLEKGGDEYCGEG